MQKRGLSMDDILCLLYSKSCTRCIYREALVPAYIQWLNGISKYHMDDQKML